MAAWFTSLFGGLASMVAAWMANKTIFVGTIIAAFTALTAAFMAAIATLSGVLYGAIPSWAVGLGYLIPDNGSLCFSTMVSARIARWIYDYHKEVLKTAATV